LLDDRYDEAEYIIDRSRLRSVEIIERFAHVEASVGAAAVR